MYILTYDEQFVLKSVARGLTSEQIANNLSRSRKSVDRTKKQLKSKLEYANHRQLVLKALELGFFNSQLNSVFESKYRLKEEQLLSLAETLYLHCLLSGFSRSEIAAQMDSSIRRIDGYHQSLCAKWGVKSFEEIIVNAIHKGYLTLQKKPTQQAYTEEFKKNIWEMFKQGITSKSYVYENIYELKYTHPKFSAIPLSTRNMNLVRLKINGNSNEKIAEQLGISVSSVYTNYYKAKAEMQVETTFDLLKKCQTSGIFRIIPDIRPSEFDEIDVQILELIGNSNPKNQIAKKIRISRKDLDSRISRLKNEWQMYSDEGLISVAVCKGIIELK